MHALFLSKPLANMHNKSWIVTTMYVWDPVQDHCMSLLPEGIWHTRNYFKVNLLLLSTTFRGYYVHCNKMK